VGYAAFNLKEATREKKSRSILKLSRVSVTVPAKEEVEVKVYIPPDRVWFMVLDVHGDIPGNVFKHRCEKDGYEAFHQTIGADNIQLPYSVPFVCEEYLRGTFENLDTVDHKFELTIFYAEIPRVHYDKIVEEVEFEDELKSLVIDAWKELSPKEKRELVRRWLRTAPGLLTALAR